MKHSNIILNIPHSSVTGIFDNEIGGWNPNPFFVNKYVNKWTEWWTDMLFHRDDPRIKSFVFPYSRFVCDVERMGNDPMEEKDQGILYTSFGGYRRKELTVENKNRLLDICKDYLKKIKDSLTESSVLIDCHSFPSELSNMDIGIGINDDWSYNQKITNLVIKVFERHGYKVSINEPYTSTLALEPGFPYSSLKIAVNKKLYMDEKLMTLDWNQRQWMRWYGCINEVYTSILNDM